MPSKRRYHIKGTNDFIVLSAIFFFLCLWAVKDAWYPSAKVLKRHPLESVATFQAAGAVDKLHVAEGDPITEDQLLASLRRDRLGVEMEEAKAAYTAARDAFYLLRSKGDAADPAERVAAEERMNATLGKVNELKVQMDATDVLAPGKGVVKQIKVAPFTMVEKGDVACVIDPKDHFYLFNKSLAVFSFFAFWLFLALHVLAR